MQAGVRTCPVMVWASMTSVVMSDWSKFGTPTDWASRSAAVKITVASSAYGGGVVLTS